MSRTCGTSAARIHQKKRDGGLSIALRTCDNASEGVPAHKERLLVWEGFFDKFSTFSRQIFVQLPHVERLLVDG